MNVELASSGAKYVLVAIVILGGMLGGIAAELMKTRKVAGIDEEGGWERPTKLSARYADLGGWASVVLGVVAAGVAMGLFDQVQDAAKVVPGTGTGTAATPASTTTVEQYEVWRVVATSLIAGFSAPKFLALAQERLLALTTQKQLEGTLLTTSAVADAHAAQADSAATSEMAVQQAAVIKAITDSTIPSPAPPTPRPDPSKPPGPIK
jgi:hypothetical protein